MAGKLIYRVEKVTRSMIKGRVQHALRESNVTVAHPEQAHQNRHLGVKNYEEFNNLLKEKLAGVHIARNDSPPIIEIFLGASPEFFKDGGDEKTLFTTALQYLKDEYGQENILSISLHKDEASPHLSAFIVPIVKNPDFEQYQKELAGAPVPPGRRKKPFQKAPPEFALSAKTVLGGRAQMSKMQTKIWEKVGKPVGLKRGIEGSKAVHINVNDWKSAMQSIVENETIDLTVPRWTPRDFMNPASYVASVKATLQQRADTAMRNATIAAADAQLAAKKNGDAARRLNAWEETLVTRATELDDQVKREAEALARTAVAGVREDLAELARFRAARDMPDPRLAELATVSAKLADAQNDRSALMRALARMIKETHSIEQMTALCAAMGVSSGRGDIFERLMKSGQVPTFEAAVLQVVAHLDALPAPAPDDEPDQPAPAISH